MRIHGPSVSPSNPFAIALLGIDAFNAYEGAKRDAGPDPRDQQFVNAALAQGHPVSSMPRGGFGGLLAKTGLISPDVQANPNQLNEETLALRQQGQQNIAGLEPIVHLRSSLGPGPFKALMEGPQGGPINEALKAAGLSADALTSETPGEMKVEAQIAEQKKKDELAQERTDEYVHHNRIQERIEDMKAHDAAYRLFLQGDSPGALSVLANRTAARGVANAEVADHTPLTAWNKSTFVDPDTLKPFHGDEKTGTVGDARRAGYAEVLPKDLSSLRDVSGVMDNLDEMQKLLPNVLVDTSKMNNTAATVAVRKRAAELNWGGRQYKDPNVAKFRQLATKSLISSIRALQGRYPSVVELKELGPDLIPNIGSTFDPRHPGDSVQSAQAKVEQMRTLIKDAYRKAALTSPGSVDSVPTPDAAPDDIKWGDPEDGD